VTCKCMMDLLVESQNITQSHPPATFSPSPSPISGGIEGGIGLGLPRVCTIATNFHPVKSAAGKGERSFP
jgi:hypothetical protein